MIDTQYDIAVKEKFIADFIKENQRRPTIDEVRFGLRAFKTQYPDIQHVGFSGYDVEKPNHGEESSARKENKTREALRRDSLTLSKKLDNLFLHLEDSHRGFEASVQRLGRVLDAQESRVNNLVLLNNKIDNFYYGVEENFSVQDKIDFVNSTVTVGNKGCSLKRKNLQLIDLQNATIQASAIGKVPLLGQSATSAMSSLLKNDGDVWEYLVYSDRLQGEVTLIIEVELPQPTYISEISLGLNSIETNDRMTFASFYSIDGRTYAPTDAYQRNANGVFLSLGVDKVKKILFKITKRAADSETGSRRQFVYLFAIDSIQMFSSEYSSELTGELIAGPYEIVDYTGKSILYKAAVCEVCSIEPVGTSVDFFLSQDGWTWKPIASNGQGLKVVSFGEDNSNPVVLNTLDPTKGASELLLEIPDLSEVNYADEAVLNLYLPAGQEIIERSLSVLRNVKSSHEPYEEPSGWGFENGLYRTTINVAEEQGRWINIGASSAVINGKEVSGLVQLHKGDNTFATSKVNFRPLANGIATLEELIGQDSLYPYNHYHLVEGYNYPSLYQGEKVYRPAGTVFETRMQYLPPGSFSRLTTSDPFFFTSYTMVETNLGKIIKVKVAKNFSSWDLERFSTSYRQHNGLSSQIWVKAFLQSESEHKSPFISSYKLRVI